MNYSFEVDYLEQIISFSAFIFRFLVRKINEETKVGVAYCVLKSEPPNGNLWLRACSLYLLFIVATNTISLGF